MTSNPLLATLLPLVADLSRELPDEERYRRLLEALRQLLPCDASALLRLEGDQLVPLAVDGLSPDTLGRRFKIAEHPRLQALLENHGPTRFAADCGLPDPYDGLVDGLHGHLEVHDCLGCPLYLDEQPWGLLTLDALDPERFSSGDLDNLQAFASLAAATVKASQRMLDLTLRAEQEQQRADAYQRAAGEAPRELIGQSPAHRRLLEEIRLVAGSDLSVLVTGETGVGKELVAQAIHHHSLRHAQPLVSLNCAALPETLVESELFGHVRGAFSGAVGERRGKFELADGGTLFLDEVGELPLAIQAKLLRVLQSGQLQRLGSDREHHVDVRLVAATNRDLAEEVRAGRFRADLYHRLSVYPLRVPPLRERGNDILLLAGYFLEQNRPRLGLRSLRLSREAQAALLGYPWPGNVRELEHLIGRASLKALAASPQRPRILSLGVADLGLEQGLALAPASQATPPTAASGAIAELRPALDSFQRQLIAASLERHAGNWAAVARELGVDRANLNRLARRLDLK
ncbi:nitric oxide reductase transcriptional regulator NorR [Pseudomonas panipatensis]|uniref:Anaerobic nitric oxide reductase transcription regulator n=1 Tax=Pseudomonas panipatensis TaxID=428992 RepID=A0A1G8CYI9_9PSED|nr:nitric oxide reductase transcriptional regulator NorR [Pseudomonas panipatensis]SDH50273.1 anaerobic nitric oxide reductase transcription regulator [Pseudomonas panipatensis]SMP63177.1 anaerobic nitric oxide reductase transcription regulator [Pseudomonas panipatensis]